MQDKLKEKHVKTNTNQTNKKWSKDEPNEGKQEVREK